MPVSVSSQCETGPPVQTARVFDESNCSGNVQAERRWPLVHLESWQAPIIIVCLSSITILGLFWDTLMSLVVTWYRSETFSHGFLVLPLSLYLVWIRRHRVAQLCPSPNPGGLL